MMQIKTKSKMTNISEIISAYNENKLSSIEVRELLHGLKVELSSTDDIYGTPVSVNNQQHKLNIILDKPSAVSLVKFA